MKLRNKKTGEIKEVIVGGYPVTGKTKMWEVSEMDANEETGYKSLGTYTSLAELNSEWEDVSEEPKEGGLDNIIALAEAYSNNDNERYPKEIVEKLKAWKRLKDYNVVFNLDFVKNKIDFTYSINNLLLDVLDGEEQIFNNMKIVFGGEE